MRQLIAGNWKMNGRRADSAALVRAVRDMVEAQAPACELVVCPPSTLLAEVAAALAGSAVAVGGQDCHPLANGPHTGDVSAAMLADAGARWVILGHSERRTSYAESNALVREKAKAAIAAGLTPIVCVGESEQQRLSGAAETVVAAQVDGSLPPGFAGPGFAGPGFAGVVAYEPIWAIGTGRGASAEDIAAMHRVIRDQLTDTLGAASGAVRVIYGGSVKPDGAAAILALPGVDGALVGGASLVAADFLAIARASSRG